MADWRLDKAAVEDALATVLPTLSYPHLAVPLASRLSRICGLSEKRCCVVLRWIAEGGHPHATQDGPKAKVYGRTVQRWRWHPTPQHKPTAGTFEARLAADGILDCSDW